MRASHWLGLDFGTSSVKALLVSGAGVVAGRAHVPYPTAYGPRGEAEQDPRDYLEAARRAISTCGAAEVELGGVGLAGQTPTVVLVAADGEPVRPALTWQDHRAEAEARLLAAELGPPEALFGTSLPWTAAYPPAKLLWLARNEPESMARTRWVLQPKDFVGLTMTGSPLSDPWSSKGLCDVSTQSPVEEILTRSRLGPSAAPPLASAWQARGTVGGSGSAAFGLPAGVPVSVGWSDALAAMLAVGAFDEPTGFVLAGTSSIVGLSSTERAPSSGRVLRIPSTCAPLEVAYGPTESAGASVDWLARLLRCSAGEVLALAASAPARTDLPVFVPYLAGERAPVWRTDVRGVVHGLSAEDGPAELALAVVLGVCLSERDVLAVAEDEAGVEAREVCVAGRGSSGPPWLSTRLATLARPLRLLGEEDASALGAAMLGAAAASGGDLGAASSLRGATRRRLSPAAAGAQAPQNLEVYRRAAAASLAGTDETRLAWPCSSPRRWDKADVD